jgi:hypothetical protein
MPESGIVRNGAGALEGDYVNGGVPEMEADLRAGLSQLNRNVDEMIRLLQCATDAGIWTPEEAMRHEARLESLRAELTADFRELLTLCERVNGFRQSTGNAHPLAKK